jgi:glycosyltransferase involved in cell wall biosynthesis
LSVLLQPVRVISAVLRLKKRLNFNDITNCLFIMPHAWDFFFTRMLRKHRITIIRCIHDFTPHPGERFPPAFYIRHLVDRSDQVLVFSRYVESKIKHRNIKRTFLPSPHTTQDANIEKTHEVLIIGRLHKYKGLELMEDVAQLLTQRNIRLSVIGSGKTNLNLGGRHYFINKWISDQEFIEHIQKAKLVLLPYIEASQSGVAATALSLKVPTVVTPVGGLKELCEMWDCGLVAERVDALSITESIVKALNQNFTFGKILTEDIEDMYSILRYLINMEVEK